MLQAFIDEIFLKCSEEIEHIPTNKYTKVTYRINWTSYLDTLSDKVKELHRKPFRQPASAVHLLLQQVAPLDSNPASVTQLVRQVDACEEIWSDGCQWLYFSLDLILLHQFHLLNSNKLFS